MPLKIAPNKLTSDDREVELTQKVSTLIGENGCGKSAILEKIFDEYFESDKKIIAYSSGLNESFHKVLDQRLEKLNRALKEYEKVDYQSSFINSFYFNAKRSGLLIYLAYSIRNNGRVREFFNQEKNKYLVSEQDPKTPIIQMNIDITDAYIKILQDAEGKEKSILTSDFHNKLEKLINKSHLGTLRTSQRDGTKIMAIKDKTPEYDFDKKQFFSSIVLLSDDIKDIFGNNGPAILTFLGILEKYQLDINSVKIYFNNYIEINDLSDGEFQLLTIYAILDLFDSEDTVFLFDEIDSHLYYENINKLWQILNAVKGKVITTTHIPDSIINNKIDSIYLVEHGLINQTGGVNSILDRLQNLSNRDFYEKKVASKIKNIALVEDETDRFIFTELLKIKLGETVVNNFLDKVYFIKCSSGYSCHTQEFADTKKKWVEKYNQINGTNIDTENIFLLSDRDNLPIESIDVTNKVKVIGENGDMLKYGNNKKAIVLSRRRKQIENYLLSYTMLETNGKLVEINILLPAVNQILEGNNLDNESIQNLEIKDNIKSLYCEEGSGVDYEKLKTIIQQIPVNEISEDIESMYNFIIGKVS